MNAKENLGKMLVDCYDRGVYDAKQAAMEAFAVAIDAAVRVEREECAKVCEELDAWNMDDPASTAATAIRARGQA